MALLRRSAVLDAPADKVFEVIEDPDSWPRYVPHVHKALDVQRSERRVGDSFRLIYKVLGIAFDERLVVTDYQRPHVYRMRVDGRMKGTQDWSLRPLGEQTEVVVDVDYQLPGGVLGKALDALILERVNRTTIDRMFENLADMMR